MRCLLLCDGEKQRTDGFLYIRKRLDQPTSCPTWYKQQACTKEQKVLVEQWPQPTMTVDAHVKQSHGLQETWMSEQNLARAVSIWHRSGDLPLVPPIYACCAMTNCQQPPQELAGSLATGPLQQGRFGLVTAALVIAGLSGCVILEENVGKRKA